MWRQSWRRLSRSLGDEWVRASNSASGSREEWRRLARVLNILTCFAGEFSRVSGASHRACVLAHALVVIPCLIWPHLMWKVFETTDTFLREPIVQLRRKPWGNDSHVGWVPYDFARSAVRIARSCLMLHTYSFVVGAIERSKQWTEVSG